MMNDYATLAEAIDHLTAAVGQPSNSLTAEILSTAVATVGSVIAVLVFELIKDHVFTPQNEFKKLRRKVNSTLSMFACYYTSQIDLARSSAKEVELYSSASKTMREMAVELMAFADDVGRKRCCGVPVTDISRAAKLLIFLSNNFFTPYNCTETTGNIDNDKIRHEIRELLKIDHKESCFIS